MTEPRCGVVHMETMRFLAKMSSGDCPAEMSDMSLMDSKLSNFKRAAYEFKMRVAETTAEGEPLLLWIQIGAHPQRCLCVGEDGAVRFEHWLSCSAPEPLWRIHYVEAQQPEDSDTKFPALFLLQSVKTGRFLVARDGTLSLQPEGDMWGLTQLRGAATPGKVLRRTAVVGGAAVAVGSVAAVGLAGAAAVTAAARTAGAVKATSAAVAGTATAVSGVAHAASGLSVAKLIGTAVAVPAAVMSAIGAASGTAAAVGTLGTVVYFGAVGAGCGVALGTGGVVSSAMAWLMNDARDPGLYVIGDQLVPLDWMRSISRLTTGKTPRHATETRF